MDNFENGLSGVFRKVPQRSGHPLSSPWEKPSEGAGLGSHMGVRPPVSNADSLMSCLLWP